MNFKLLKVFFGTFAPKVTQTWFFLHETLHTTLFGIYYCVECIRFINHRHILNITWLVVILSFFGTFANQVAHTWFVLHETLHTTLFGIYYCVKHIRIVNHSHILNIT